MLLNSLAYTISVVILITLPELIVWTSVSSSMNSVLRQFDTSDVFHVPFAKHLLVVVESVFKVISHQYIVDGKSWEGIKLFSIDK